MSKKGQKTSTILNYFKKVPKQETSHMKNEEESFCLLEIVLAKYADYPPWPAIICHDKAKKYLNGEMIHVQFFDVPVSTGWVKLKNVVYFENDPTKLKKSSKWVKPLQRSYKEAAAALGMTPSERMKLIKTFDDDLSEEEKPPPKKRRKRSMAQKNNQVKTREVDKKSNSQRSVKIEAGKLAKAQIENYLQEQEETDPELNEEDPAWVPGNAVEDKGSQSESGSVKPENKNENEPSEITSSSQTGEEISEYEMIRKRNIENRRKLFQELQIKQIKEEISPTSVVPDKNRPSRRGLATPQSAAKKDKDLPSRRSLRLQKIDADTGLSLPDKEPTSYNVPDVDEHPRLPLKDLNLEEFVSSDANVDEKSGFLSKVSQYLECEGEMKKALPSFGSDVGKQLAKLKITDEQVAKVVPNRIFSLAVHPNEDRILVAVGGKWGSVGLWDIMDTSSPTDGVQLFNPHSRPVNCMDFDITDPTKLISTSYDGTVRLFDLNKKKSVLLFAEEKENFFTTYHKQIDSNTFLVTLGSTGKVALIDRREYWSKTANLFQVFNKGSAKTVDIHPIKSYMFLCPNNKGECFSFDMREKKMSPIFKYLGHTKALSCAFYSKDTGKSLCTVAYDNKIRLFCSSSAQGKDIHPYKSITHNNQTGRWLTTFKAEWHPLRDDLFFVGSMAQPRQIDIFSDQGFAYPSLKGENLASVCSIVKCHPTLNVVVGGNASGRIHIFK